MSRITRRALALFALAALALVPASLAAQARINRPANRSNGPISVRWLGHATFEVTSPGGTTLLLDPFISQNPSTPDSLKKSGAATKKAY